MDLIFLIKQFISWRSVLDVFIIAAVFFFLYRTFLRLGTWKIVTGILAATVLFWVASFLDLKGLEWIFNNLSHVAVIALIVIFQPELRKIFERAVSVRGSKLEDAGEELSSMIAVSLLDLARNRRGALIVFPGKEPIREWLSGGFPLDGKPSFPLVMSLFDPNSPGHDGALVIRDGRFSRFGVRLPVSQSHRLSEEYGTRHHAAMGLAEKSDALVIAVSEERGKIAAFSKGGMRNVDDHGKIKEAIMSHWRDTASFPIEMPMGGMRWTVLFQMTASLALAVLFWSMLILTQGELLEKVLTVPVEYTQSMPDIVLVGDKSKEVRLHLAGARSVLDDVESSRLSATIDLSKAVPGKQTFLITQENIRLPKGVTLLDVEPPSVELTLAAIVEHEVVVNPQLVGRLPAGHIIKSIQVTPKTVRVLSPADKKDMEKIKEITTTPIYLESIYEDTKIYCKIIAPPAVQPADKRWPDVEVMIRLQR
jgi:diadenylate cyclase